ncbi:hypothetical protein EJ06DRAFT_582358 [Trichodelitschia bisporula]|uniref:GRF-type domain-containing protein n=1 Tax=Trichodelitschia bisporula TaxID=703511 RepID=A0A6G1HWU8_9PEZI|nr:hypothetical protein EJ06DRAFT_582358 [Trichodelitschia bisporula]
MEQSPQKSQGGFKGGSKGIFIDGLWLCDCQPREIARQNETKKAGPNQGRLFYVCPKPIGQQQCGFFLWVDQAKIREKAGNNTHPNLKPPPTNSAPYNTSWQPHPVANLSVRPSSTTSPAQHSTAQPGLEPQGQSSDGSAWSVGSDEEQMLADAADAAMPRRGASMGLQTPRKANAQWSGPFTTPGKRKFAQLDTPPGKNLFGSAGRAGSRQGSPSKRPIGSALGTPTARRLKEVEEGELFTDIVDSLREFEVPISNAAAEDLKKVCAKHEKQLELRRLVITAKDAKIQELEGRIKTLEAEADLAEHMRSTEDESLE